MVSVRFAIIVSVICAALLGPLFSFSPLSVEGQASIHELVTTHVSPGWFGLSADEHLLRGTYCDQRELAAPPRRPLPRVALSGVVSVFRWVHSFLIYPHRTVNSVTSVVVRYLSNVYVFWTTVGLSATEVATAYRGDVGAKVVGPHAQPQYMERACSIAYSEPEPRNPSWVRLIRACDCHLVYKPLPDLSGWRVGLWLESAILGCTNLLRSLTAFLVASKWLAMFTLWLSLFVSTFVYLARLLWRFARGAAAGHTIRASYHHWTPSPEEVTHHAKASRNVDCHWPVQQRANLNGHTTLAEIRARLLATAVNITGRLLRGHTSPVLTDVCGIPKNHGRPDLRGADGAKVHVRCVLPQDLEAQRRVTAPVPEGVSLKEVKVGHEVCEHRHPVLLSFCDWYYSKDQLCTMFSRSWGFIATQKFSPGTHTLYDGEAVYTRHDNGIVMNVRGGMNYNHGFHDWEFEGYVVGRRGVLSYKTVMEQDGFSLIFVWPTSATISDDSRGALKSVSVGKSLVSQGLHMSERHTTWVDPHGNQLVLNQEILEWVAVRCFGNPNLLGLTKCCMDKHPGDKVPIRVYADAAVEYHLRYLYRSRRWGLVTGKWAFLYWVWSCLGGAIWTRRLLLSALQSAKLHVVYSAVPPPPAVGNVYRQSAARDQGKVSDKPRHVIDQAPRLEPNQVASQGGRAGVNQRRSLSPSQSVRSFASSDNVGFRSVDGRRSSVSVNGSEDSGSIGPSSRSRSDRNGRDRLQQVDPPLPPRSTEDAPKRTADSVRGAAKQPKPRDDGTTRSRNRRGDRQGRSPNRSDRSSRPGRRSRTRSPPRSRQPPGPPPPPPAPPQPTQPATPPTVPVPPPVLPAAPPQPRVERGRGAQRGVSMRGRGGRGRARASRPAGQRGGVSQARGDEQAAQHQPDATRGGGGVGAANL